MYLTFFGLDDKPFTTAPDPRLLYLSPGHREAFSQLVYGIQERVGFIVLTGDIGSGKTTLLQALVQHLDGNADVAFIVNSGLSFDGLLAYLLDEFRISETGQSRAERLLALKRFLIERHRAGRQAVLIIDEAQNLDVQTLEYLRMLSNFETSSQKLVQIVLAGQPSLHATLERPDLYQLKQRIVLWAGIRPLSRDETLEYISSRLRIAGARDAGILTARAARAIADHARGIPRVVNIIADHCLLIGYADQKRRLDVDVVEQAVRYLRRTKAQRAASRRNATLPLERRRSHAPLSQRVAVLVSTLVQSARGLLGS